MLLKLKYDLSYVAAATMAIFVAALAATDLMTSLKYAPYFALDALIRKHEPVSARAVETYAARLTTLPDTCRSDVINATINVAMRNVEQKTALIDRQPWISALQSMEPLLRDGMTCMPTNGMLWAQLATVRWLLGGTAEEQAVLLNMSQAYAPAEIKVLRARFTQWQRVSPMVISQSEHALRSDIRTVLNYGSPALVKEILAKISPQVVPIVADEGSLVSEPRKRLLAAAKIELPAAN